MSTPGRPSSGLDFSDRQSESPLDQHPDLSQSNPVRLERNKTERRRLQGLQLPSKQAAVVPYQPVTLRQKISLWMINEGSKQLFFAAWIILHLLVTILGFMNYQLRDNSVIARRTFGITFRQSLLLHSVNFTETNYFPVV